MGAPATPYDAIADWYDESARSGALSDDLLFPAVLELTGDVKGLRVCDLACGQGRLARLLADRGARVTGIDLSPRLLDLARRYEEEQPRGVRYEQDDAQALSGVTDASFEGVVCNMSLMDIPDVDALLAAVSRVLRSGSWFVFSITHPCFQTPVSGWVEREGRPAREAAGYFEEGFWRSHAGTTVRGQVGAHHRTLSTYLNALAAVGLRIERVLEPRPEGALAERMPSGYREVPAFLVARCRRG
jgi:SAM-dependent methyltransferase